MDFQAGGAWLVRLEAAAGMVLRRRIRPGDRPENIPSEIAGVDCTRIRGVEWSVRHRGTQLRWTIG